MRNAGRPLPFAVTVGERRNTVSFERTPDGGIAESMDETHSQPLFVGRLAMTLAALAILFAILVIIGAVTHPAVF